MGRKSRHKVSIKKRILMSLLALIGIIFLCVMLAFNMLVNLYIKQSATRQLQKSMLAVKKVSNHLKPGALDGEEWDTGEISKVFGVDRELLEKIKAAEKETETQVMIADAHYKLVFPIASVGMFNKIKQYDSLMAAIKQHQSVLDEGEIYMMESEGKHFYLASMKIHSLQKAEDYYLILFINISRTLHLEQKINAMLLLVMGIAALLAAFLAMILSRNIAKPIQQLCKFAKQIGEGNFSRYTFNFSELELDELAQIMNKSAEQLEQYDKEQKQFFQNVSHELRTPLMSIKGYAEAIQYHVIPEEEASRIIIEESDRLGEIVEELLYISKMDNITQDYTLTECDLRELLSNCVVKQKAKAISEGITFHYDFDQQAVLLNCDERNMTRAFLNLIANGMRYAQSEINIRCRYKQDSILIEIEDDGAGIAEKDLPHIFERFYKGEQGKHGIGLSIVKSIIEKHHGEVTAENSERGAKFIVRFAKERH